MAGLPSMSTRPLAPRRQPTFTVGYCGVTTGAEGAGACETGEKGSFGAAPLRHAIGRWTWDAAVEACRAQCLRCKRCNYFSVSI